MVRATNLGFPRVGVVRALKRLTEAYWAGAIDTDELQQGARDLRAANWRLQAAMGLDHIPSNDFSFYDHVLDATVLFGAVPDRFVPSGGAVDLDAYFALARGTENAPAMEMTKWFDTNYHYLVAELAADQSFRLAGDKPIAEFREALALGIKTRPVLVGPVTYLCLSKLTGGTHGMTPLGLLDRLLPAYQALLTQLADAGADWVQLDEPCLTLDLDEHTRAAYRRAYETLAATTVAPQLLVATYFGGLRDNREIALSLPIAALHVDLARAPQELEPLLASAPPELTLSLGVVDGRNVWRTDLDRARDTLQRVVARRGADRVMVASSCSLLHVPLDLDTETDIDPEVRTWLAFAKQKLREIVVLAKAARGEDEEALFAESRAALEARARSSRVRDVGVRARLAAITPDMESRLPYAERAGRQATKLALPRLPTTTIGSFPQTRDVRKLRAAYRRGKVDREAYERSIEVEIERAIRWQEEIGIDVLVHGEFERSDMVEYFAERLDGYVLTQHGWVQSYGTRYVKPPILYGDVARRAPMTVRWAAYAQSLTRKPVKGMLTGPVTMLHWSFVRDDQPDGVTARQLALAIRDEAVDLEAAGLRVVQIDEPAFREGLPLGDADRKGYLEWAVQAFRLASSGVRPETQIHTHMCYSEFNNIIEAVAALDADVLSIETARSRMELLDAFERFRYPNAIGPGVYDIHSPRVPSRSEILTLLEKAIHVLRPDQVWVNPDCGLKTRRWDEVEPALALMVDVAREVRSRAA
ncbi:MAG: 5-methyltetrahydropteroyltriglutamate--homocysteine S-methyltransferase [Luteitalea sp.]|nr:5-methyltetrahydropteroyltriglutamate--homocysteine S-methyltransferase [Luteitalea sp.]